MEIALVNNSSIRIKGKQGSVIVNPSAKAADANGYIFLSKEGIDKKNLSEEAVILKGPGEYEFGGIKISGIRVNSETVYSLRVDRVEVLLGKAKSLEKDYSKVNEHQIVLMYNSEAIDPSFVTSLASNVIIFYGEKAQETMDNFAKDGYRIESKYSTTYEKLPQEIEKILLQ